MKKKQRIIISSIGILIILLTLIGITYGYFLTRIQGNTSNKSISIDTANLELVYDDGTDNIEINNSLLLPSDNPVGTKEFSVTNKTPKSEKTIQIVNYEVIVEDFITLDKDGNESRFNHPEAFKYTLTCTTKKGEDCGSVTEKKTFDISNLDSITDADFKETSKISIHSIEAGDIHNYVLTLYYTDTKSNQTKDKGKRFKAKVNIISDEFSKPFIYNKDNTLAYKIADSAYNNVNNTPLYTINTKNTYYYDENSNGLGVTEDENGTALYFKGNVTNNYVNFAGKCWNIVNVAGDRSIKLILYDDNNTCSQSSTNANQYIKRKDTDTNYWTYFDSNYSNEIYTLNFNNIDFSSTRNYVSTVLKSYNDKFTAEQLSKMKSGGWCFDNKVSSLTEQEKETKIANKQSFIYDAGNRLHDKYIGDVNLKCNGTIINKFKDGSNMYVGMLTADEAHLAKGNLFNIANVPELNSYMVWTLTPYGFMSFVSSRCAGDSVYILNNNSYTPVCINSANQAAAVRPVIVLKANIRYISGDGTKDNPYEVE